MRETNNLPDQYTIGEIDPIDQYIITKAKPKIYIP